MRLPVSRFLLLAQSIPERIRDDNRLRLIEQAYGAWLIGGQLHALPIPIAQMQGAQLNDAGVTQYLNAYLTWTDYLTSLGLIDKDEPNGRKSPAQN